MGRFVYQPVPIELASRSKHGQLIVDIYSGHISTNHHNVIVSATERIESKLDDVFQIESNIIEQTNVIFNLDDDYTYLVENQYSNMLYDYNETKLNVYINENDVRYLRMGIEDKEGDPCILTKLREAIRDMLDIYSKSTSFQNTVIEYSNSFLSGDLKSLANPLSINGDFTFNGNNFLNYVSEVTKECSNQKDDIVMLRNNLLGSL